MNNITVERISDINEFESIKDMWNELLMRSSDNNIYLTHEWLSTWWKYYGKGKKLRIFLIKYKDDLVGIFPLMSCCYSVGPFKVNILENIGSTYSDYSGAILAERHEEAIAAFLNHLCKIKMDGNRALMISQIPHDSQFIILLQRQLIQLSDSFSFYKKIVTRSPYFYLPLDFKKFCGTISKKRKKNLRYALRSLRESHSIEYKVHNINDDLYHDLELFFNLSLKRWSNSFSGQVEQRERAFFFDLANKFRANGWLDLSFLFANNDLLSSVIGFNYNKKFYYSNQTYNPDYSKYSPGSIHLLQLIRKAIGCGTMEFDFLKGDEAYKLLWTDSVRDNLQIILITNGFFRSWFCKLLPHFLRFSEIALRGFSRNYHLYLEKRKQEKAKEKINLAKAGSNHERK